ncbi:MAG: hypothetical protein UX91_C0006G0158 [Candidatus Amesbacteria bacterium GW2011_GWB1_47_19]|nr:MAG: hypothetical protein UW51_C0002G0159 [Candidatus Amesbacteria bacterium GW2011_GWA1_44_24]KKU31250.1 MAG: hypothetical protein UX46_C0006G0042 [Candidatus Amesbacteria bacterium GW2011_GWC1_46_24]KKU67096.1 MAG: hypothetical protein UX91_C0006G0158 [Candidatus Amesbacteria bacterium GW2011_GWB1_47_19]OGD04915.1 MAG: hypothetical protein A2379_04005 [Candidatus Amesbacteria bacterium RIFOXYB1_FULL_47_13]HBC72965.1 hypothetical protein [Candidatus Amesbacteria bacterium]
MTEMGITNEAENVLICLRNDRVEAEVDPKGAFVNRLSIDGETVLFPRTSELPKRGGIPVLGPTPGKVAGTEWGHLYSDERMPQHGTDRVILWEIANMGDAQLRLRRYIGPAEFHFAGRKDIDIKLIESGLSMVTTIVNHTGSPKEIGHGLHPYFDTSHGFDVTTAGLADYFPLEPGKAVVTDGRGLGRIEMVIGGSNFVMETNPDPVKILLWSDKPDQYVCVEPWHADRGSGIIIPAEGSLQISTVIRKI